MKAVFTVITPNYISLAKTLGDSVIAHNPDYVFFICLIGNMERLDKTVNLKSFSIIEIAELHDYESINSMESKYSAFELSCALKPYFAEYILTKQSVTRLKYIDSDVMIYNSFDPQIESNTQSSIFLTPHFFIPVAPAENGTHDATLIKSGVFNAGYFEVNNSEMTFLFLNWWKERLFDYCFAFKPPFEQIFVDQCWLNLVPVFFKDTFIINHLGYNTSFFNLHERKISYTNGKYYINEGIHLIFFHFTGYKYYRHDEASVYNPKYTFKNTPFLEQICSGYREVLINNAVQQTLPMVQADSKKRYSIKKIIGKSVNKVLAGVLKIKIIKVEK